MSEADLLRSPENEDCTAPSRKPSAYYPLQNYHLPGGDQRVYQQQYGDMYFMRLAKLKPAVEQAAGEAWADFEIGGERVQRKDRVLDVRQGELCWVVGTVYMDMPLKPNILDDISKDVGSNPASLSRVYLIRVFKFWISAPPPREKYISPTGEDQIMLEDESGRLRLVGLPVQTNSFVTGCIIAAMGTENAQGEFESIDIKVADLPRQPQRWERDDGDIALANGASNKRKRASQNESNAGVVAIVSGLEISGDEADSLSMDLLMEFLLGEAGGAGEQLDASHISRLLIAGNSLSNASIYGALKERSAKKNRKYGQDAIAYNPAPTALLDNFLATLLASIPVTLIPGESDPASVSLPQQPIHPAMLPRSRNYANMPGSDQAGWFDTTTNPWEGDVDGWRLMCSGGQAIDDIFRYVEGNDRLEMMENLLRWRNAAPTAPDTLWCYPFQDDEPFIIEETPHVFISGNQPIFETTIIEGPIGQTVRLVCVPSFKQTGQIVLLNMESLEVEVVKVGLAEDSQI